MKTGKELIKDIGSYTPRAGECAFWWLGQQSFVLKFKGAVCYVDPFLTPVKGRLVRPLLRPSEITNATLILGSHDHADHIDRAAWPEIAKASPKALFVVPKLLRNRIVKELGLPDARVKGIDCKTSVTRDGIRVTGVPAAHEFLDLDQRTGLHPYLGFAIESSGICIYHAGDTCLYEGMQNILRKWRFDLAFLPINGRDAKRLASNCIGNMTYLEAADLAAAIRPGLTIPAHFDMFSTNSEDPRRFIGYMRVKYPHLKAQIPAYGKRTIVRGPISP